MNTTHHSVRIYENYGKEDQARKTVTGYALHHKDESHSRVYTVRVDEPETRAKAIRKMCKLLAEGWFITSIFYSDTQP